MDEIARLCEISIRSSLFAEFFTHTDDGIRIDDGPLKYYVVRFSPRVKARFRRAKSDLEVSSVVTCVARAIRDEAGIIAKSNQTAAFSGIKVYSPSRSKPLKVKAKLI